MENSALLTCHCGAVEINLTLPNGIENIARCSCSICSRKYCAITNLELEKLEVVKGKDNLKEYSFHTHISKHWFCSICGIHTHHHSRMSLTKYAVNLACIEGIKIEDYADAPWFDGREHPKDQINEKVYVKNEAVNF